MVGVLQIYPHLKLLHHRYTVFRSSDGRVVTIVIVYISQKQEFGMTRSSDMCVRVSTGGNIYKYKIPIQIRKGRPVCFIMFLLNMLVRERSGELNS
jgi:hypothetical protein